MHKIKFISSKAGKLCVFMFVVLCSSAAASYCQASPYGITRQNYTLDVYKSAEINAEMVDKKYHNELRTIAAILLRAHSLPTAQNKMGLGQLFETVLGGLNKTGHFAYLGLSPVVYPGSDKIGFTVDVVDASDKQRIEGFLAKPVTMISDPDHLIESWLQYEKTAFNYMMRTKNPRPFKHCPAFHCVFGFEAAELQAYGDKFNTQVPKFKHQLIAILRNDQDDLKRGAAAYLLAHLADGREVVAALSPSMRDSSSHVRNNVMRVLAQTATHIHDANFPLADAIRALTYPTTTDRNKALYMLDMLTADPKSANYVRLNGCHQLMEQFKLVQPNLHDESYNVLVKISQQHYPDTDFMAWDNWVANHCANAVSA